MDGYIIYSRAGNRDNHVFRPYFFEVIILDIITEIEQFRREIEPYLRNQFVGQASGETPVIADGAEGILLRSAILKGKTTIIAGEGNKADTVVPSVPENFVMEQMVTAENVSYGLPDGLQMYSTPNNEYRDSYDLLSGTFTKACGIALLKYGWPYKYTQEGDQVTWITSADYIPGKNYYCVLNGKTSSNKKVDWQGKIELFLSKAEIGITAEDTVDAAKSKIISYFGDSYAILPLKTPEITEYPALQIIMPGQSVAFHAQRCDTEITYARDMNAVYNELKNKR